VRWRKLGLIYAPDGTLPWAQKYAAFPTAEVLANGVVRVYITSLDAQNFGRGGYVDLDSMNLTEVLGVSEHPVLDVGSIGDFDDAGANPFAVINLGDQKFMYYQGWQRTLRAPYAIFTGLAIARDNGPFIKWARIPVLERSNDEPHIRGAPFIIAENGYLRMWYVGSDKWSYVGDRLHYHVQIRYAVSADGIRWEVDPRICLSPQAGEYAVGRPVVINDNSAYRMWYSIRSFDHPYRIGYAESEDGLHWIRRDDAVGITRSASGWDSEMICYGYVLRIRDRLIMFYNGNQHGASGFGCAVLEADD
jgi:hypothetical protein